MENASKALIIAGAILLAILIIGLGIFIYRQAANTVSDTGMDQLAVQQFNGQFENYLDKSLSATTAKALIDTINTSNATEDEDRKITYTIDGEETTDKSKIKSGEKYTAKVPENGKTSSGMIKQINIESSGYSSQLDPETEV